MLIRNDPLCHATLHPLRNAREVPGDRRASGSVSRCARVFTNEEAPGVRSQNSRRVVRVVQREFEGAAIGRTSLARSVLVSYGIERNSDARLAIGQCVERAK